MVADNKFSTLKVRVLTTLLFLSFCVDPAGAGTDALLDSTLKKVGSHDFISYFGFVENNVAMNPNLGLTEHTYYSKNWTCTLKLSVDRANRVVHMILGVPRPLIDDEKVCTRGRDIVKSFVLASAIDEDVPQLKQLADEVYVRGLALTPIKDAKTSAKSTLDKSSHMQAYKVGKGPVTNGDNAIFMESMPKLAAGASEQFDTVIGKRPGSIKILQNSRVSFANEIMPGSKSMTVLWCETWDENFWKSVFAAVQKTKK